MRRDMNVISTGFNNLDDVLGGYRGGELIVLGGRPAIGKTTLALNMLNYIAIGKNHPCLFISMENSKRDLEKRLSMIGGDGTFEKIYHIDGQDNRFVYFEDDYENIATNDRIFDTIRRYKEEYGIQFVVIDYLQMFVCSYEEESQFLDRLKELALELNLPIMLLSQLGRGMEYRDGRVPKLEDFDDRAYLREKPDALIALTREGYYDCPIDRERTYDAELTVLKNSRGVPGSAKLTWLPDRLWFVDRAEGDMRDNNGFDNQKKSTGNELVDKILGNPFQKSDTSENNKPEYEARFQEKLLSKLTEIMEILTDSEKKVIASRYGLDGEKKTYAEIAKINGMTEDQVRELEMTALRKLRHPRRLSQLKSIIASASEDDSEITGTGI